MSERFRQISLTRAFNSPARLGRGWAKEAAELSERMPRGRRALWGIPFALGPKDLAKPGLVVLGAKPVRLRLSGKATHLCLLHSCNPEPTYWSNLAGGEHLADYALIYADGTEHVQPIRRRFEINPCTPQGWGMGVFAAVGEGMPYALPPKASTEIADWGYLQTGVGFRGSAFATWVYALENPHPHKELAALELRRVGSSPVAVLGLTLYSGPGHPLRHVPSRVYRLLLPADEKTKPSELKTELDMGVVLRQYAAPGQVDEKWLQAAEAGLGAPRPADEPAREFLVEATGAEGAMLTVAAGEAKHEIPFGDAFTKGKAKSADGRARIELIQPGKTWVHVTVLDGETGRPTPTRIHFRGKHGEYLAPYGHHTDVNERWFEDYGGDLKLQGTNYAYVPGRFQIDLPVGEVYVEISKGFEYAPVRRKLDIKPGQREVTLSIGRMTNLRERGWVTADTHVHFISPQTAWLEGQGEGLNLINLLASQWGKLFTNVADITGGLSGVSTDDTLVWVGTENRHHLLGHISMLGTHGDPVYPMCSGGPGEAFIGDPEMYTLTEWAETCRRREGVAIRPHWPFPVCEEPVYVALGQLDGVELRTGRSGQPGTLDQLNYSEWYRYLNCGYRVAAVGGTDKMSAGMAVGSARTYALLDRDDAFTFENWGKAVRAGRTYTTTGALMDLQVEGRTMGDEIRLPAGGGTLEVRASAQCAWPLHRIEIVVNGQVVASADRKEGARSLSVSHKVDVRGSCWIAARCASRLVRHVNWMDQIGAHTSPVYVVVDNQEIFSPSEASYMLTLIDGGLTYLDTLSVRYDEERHRKMKAVYERAKAAIHARMHAHGHGHHHGRG
jgi:hypothetical protein